MALVWVATAPIRIAPNVRAFNINDIVPDSVADALGITTSGLVVRREVDISTGLPGRGVDPVTQDELDALVAGAGRLSPEGLRAAYVSLAGTDQAAIPVVRQTGDGRTSARWEYIHDGGGGYIWHLLTGADTVNGDWSIGFGVDGGSGGAFIVRNKAAGVATKYEQLNTITSAEAFGQYWQQNSMAPLVCGELFPDGSAPLLRLVSYRSDLPDLNLAEWFGANGKHTEINAATAELLTTAAIGVRDGGILRLAGNLAFDPNDSQIRGTPYELRFVTATGDASLRWPKRITHAGQSLMLQTADTTAGGPDADPASWVTGIELKNASNATQLGFYGKAPVAQQARPTDLAGVIAALAALGLTA